MRQAPVRWEELIAVIGLWGVAFGALGNTDIPVKISLVTLAGPVVLLIAIAQLRVWRRQEFVVVDRDPTRGNAEELIKYIESSKRTIFVTHFRREEPSAAYLQALDQAADQKVMIRRIVGVPRDHLEDYPWTKWLTEEINRPNRYHAFLDLRANNMLFGILIVDNEVGVLTLPLGEDLPEGPVPRVLASTNKAFVSSLKTTFEGYWRQASNGFASPEGYRES